MMRAALLCMVLAGCASAPQVIEKPVEVKVPVPVACKAHDVPVPAWPLEAVPASASDFDFFKAALAVGGDAEGQLNLGAPRKLFPGIL